MRVARTLLEPVAVIGVLRRGLFGARAFAAMKPGAVFISTARGGIHDESALHDALRGGHLRGAGLDVWEQEPPDRSAPLLALNNVVATFHTAGVTHEARRSVARSSATQLAAMLRGETQEVLQAMEARMMAHSDKLEFEQAAEVRNQIQAIYDKLCVGNMAALIEALRLAD